MSNNNIKPPRYTWSYIRGIADSFRAKYLNPPDDIPVPIEEIVEFNLKIEVIPKAFIKRSIDIDGFISNDLKTIYVDDQLLEKRNLNRYRFTLAHEIGHYKLHLKEIKQFKFRNSKDWIKMREDMDEDELNWFEQQAYEFAGRLLVPREKLLEVLETQREKIERFTKVYPENGNAIIEAISRIICTKFQVSPQTMEKRIEKEGVWQELGF